MITYKIIKVTKEAINTFKAFFQKQTVRMVIHTAFTAITMKAALENM